VSVSVRRRCFVMRSLAACKSFRRTARAILSCSPGRSRAEPETGCRSCGTSQLGNKAVHPPQATIYCREQRQGTHGMSRERELTLRQALWDREA
jgi:hypothetical protein